MIKKFLPYILILVVIVGVFVPTHFAHAQATAVATIISWYTGGSLSSLALNKFSLVVFQGMLAVLGWITGISGVLLNYVLDYTVVNMSANISTMVGINIAWKVIRDLMNIAFIFMLVYEGIKLIIGSSIGGSTANVKKFITGLVLASLLINFSLFFTKVLIDASNIVTIGFYNSAIGPRQPLSTVYNYGLSNAVTQSLRITGLYSSDVTPGAGDFGGLLIWVLGSGLILVITSFIFFAITILFVVRYIVLIILLMLSPVAYMGMALPFMQPYAKQWWNALQSQLLFAPIYMIMTWVILTIIGTSGFVTTVTNTTFADMFALPAQQPTTDSLSMIINFAVIIGMLIASLIIAKSTSTAGSKHISTAVGKVSAFAGGVVAGSTARLGRNTLGRYGNAKLNDQDLLDRAAKGDISARMQLATANKFASSTFDARATKSLGSLSKATGFDLGKVNVKTDNFKAIKDAQVKAAEEYAKRLKPSDLSAEQAKVQLGSDDFKAEEAERKEAHEKQIKSEGYIKEKTKIEEEKLDLDQKDIAEMRVNEVNIRNARERIADARNKMTSTAVNAPDKDQLKLDIEKHENEIRDREKTVRNVKADIESREKAWKDMELEENNYISEERKKLIARAGGTKEETKGNGDNKVTILKDAAGNVIGKKDKDGKLVEGRDGIKSAYEQRTEAVAKRIETAGRPYRYTAIAFGTAANVIGVPGVSIPQTKADRQQLALNTRRVAKDKSKKEKLADLAKEVSDEDKAKDGNDEPEVAPPPTPAPAPEPSTPPTT